MKIFKKNYLILGVLILLIDIFIVYPLECRNSPYPEFVYTVLVLIAGIIIILNGLFNSNFLKILVFLSFCISSSMFFLYVLEGNTWGRNIVVFWCGIPSGAIAGILFLIINHFLVKNKTGNIKLHVIQGFILIIIYTVVVSTIMWGGDILYYFFPPSYDS